MKIKKSHFLRNLLIYSLVLVLAAAGVLFILERFLTAYEASRPEHAVERFVSSLTQQDVIDGCDVLLSTVNPALQSRQEAEQIIRNALAEPFHAAKDAASQNEILYCIYSGPQKIGSFHLISTGTDAFNFAQWEAKLDSFDMSGLVGQETSLTVPDNARVLFLGKELSRDFVTQSNIPFDILREFPQDDLPQCSTYQVSGYLGEANWQVYTPNGTEITGQDYQEILLGENCSDVEQQALESRILTFLDQYIAYCGSNKNNSRWRLSNMRDSLVPDGLLYQRLASALDGLNYGTSIADTRQDTKIHCIKKFSEEVYFADVTYVVDTTGKEGVVSTTTNLRLILVPSGNTFLVSDMCGY